MDPITSVLSFDNGDPPITVIRTEFYGYYPFCCSTRR